MIFQLFQVFSECTTFLSIRNKLRFVNPLTFPASGELLNNDSCADSSAQHL